MPLFLCLPGELAVLPTARGGSIEGTSALTVEPGSDGVGGLLIACSQRELLLFKPSDDVLLSRAGCCPCHSLISVIYKASFQVRFNYSESNVFKKYIYTYTYAYTYMYTYTYIYIYIWWGKRKRENDDDYRYLKII